VVFSITLLSALSAPQNALAGAAPSCVTASSDIVGWWPLDETTGTNSKDIGGPNDGTHTNGPVPVPGKVNGGLSFDGMNDAVVLDNAPELHLQSFTIEAWIKRASTSVAGGGSGFQEGEILTYGTNGYAFGLLGTTNELFLSKTDVNLRKGGPTITDNTNFHHVAVTKSGTSVIFYVNGVPSNSMFYSTSFSFNTNVAIGARGDLTSNPASFLGIIDELSVYNRALTPVEIDNIFKAGSAGKCQLLDSTPPFFTSIPDIEVTTTEIGEFVNFDLPTAVDDMDPNPVVECNTPSGSFFVIGLHDVNCIATDTAGNEVLGTFVVTVINEPPIADAGPNQNVDLEVTVQLDGTDSSDPEGGDLTYKWTYLSDCFANFSSFVDTAPKPTFITFENCVYVFSLIVSDGVNQSTPDKVAIISLSPLSDLTFKVLGLLGDPLDTKDFKKLDKWIAQATKHLEKGQDKLVDKKLDKFIKNVEALVSFGKLSDAIGQELINLANIAKEKT